uniref:Cellulase n=1 Tax=Corethron hystrix TaxID=216773 RepID=A0A7S1B7J5_9STRA|mmetsp:Transcript_16148/g.36330  ORF Transcript_16148/g.36330 Transcript_16148/m.36330 type:complete len:700 (+) Transcript_16148:1943-4042(+)
MQCNICSSTSISPSLGSRLLFRTVPYFLEPILSFNCKVTYIHFFFLSAICINSPSGMPSNPAPTPVLTPTPVKSPTSVTPYCNWGPLGTGESSVCDGEAQGGEWCNVNKDQCEDGCGGKWCTTAPQPTPAPVPVGPQPTKSNIATTTRYWDCSGGACGCSYVPEGLNNPDEPSHCYSNAMFKAPKENEYGAKYYGAAAISYHLGGGGWMSEGCGKCWKITGSANIKGYESVGETTIVIKGTNFCPPANSLCGAGPHFDIAAPGFDVLKYSLAHDCPNLELDELEGFQACSEWMIDDQNPDKNCDCSTFKNPILKAGCKNFYSLKWDNPQVTYEELDACPKELSSLHCGYPYPDEENMPETCASNVFEPTEPTPPTKAPVKSPEKECPEGWNSASWTWYHSYAPCCPDSPNYDPEYPTTECDLYSACKYTGSFAYAGKRDYDWVGQNDIIAFFSTNGDNASYENKKIKIKAKSQTVTAWVLDTCGDNDCNGCCTKNSQPSGYLVDMESHTVERYFGGLNEVSGEVCWKLDNSPPTGYCSWYKCDGEVQDDPYCNFDSQNCLGECGGSYYCIINSTPLPTQSPVTNAPTTSPPACKGEFHLMVELKTDKPKENKYFLFQQDGTKWNRIIKSSGLKKKKLNVSSHCLDMSKCYKFVIRDKKGNGIDGWYRVLLNDIQIHKVTNWTSGNKMEYEFGICPRPKK